MLLLFASFVTICFNSCSDDLDGCGLTVIVKDALTGERISGANIHISKNAGTITRDGVSDENGEAYFFFDNEAIFDINATYGVVPYTKSGKSSKRLKYNEVVKQEVILQ